MRMARRVKRTTARRSLFVVRRNGMRVCAGWVGIVFSPEDFVMLMSVMFGELCLFLLKNVLLDVHRRACWLFEGYQGARYSSVACLRFMSSSVLPRRCMSSTTRLSRNTMLLISKMLPKGVKGSRSPMICLVR